MSFLKNLTKDNLEQSRDQVGGFKIHDSDMYSGKIQHAFLAQWGSGAHYMNLSVKLDNGSVYNENITITNASGENFWERDGKKHPLPGFTILDDIALCTAGVSAAELDEPEEKVVNIYDKDAGAQVPKAVPMLMQLVGADITLGIIKKIETVMDKNQATGKYDIITDKERESNFIDKVFHNPSNLTTVEARNGKEEAAFYEEWIKANKGKVRDARKKGSTGTAGAPVRPGAPKAAAPGATAASGAPAQKKPLFGNKG